MGSDPSVHASWPSTRDGSMRYARLARISRADRYVILPFIACRGQPGSDCLNVYTSERRNCASCPWMDVPHRASLAMFKEAVLISALVRMSRLGYPQESHIAMVAEYV